MNTTPNDTSDTFDHDAQLTAFALGELSGDEAAALAARVDRDDDLRREVEEIRRTSAMVAASLAGETAVGLTRAQRAAIIEAGEAGGGAKVPGDDRERGVLFSFMSMRTVWGGLGLAAAACLAIVFIWPGVVGPRDQGTVAIDLLEAPSAEEPFTDRSSVGDRKDVAAKQALASAVQGPAPSPVGGLEKSLARDVVTSPNGMLAQRSGRRAEHEEQAASEGGAAGTAGFGGGGEARVREALAGGSFAFEDRMKNERADDQEADESAFYSKDLDIGNTVERDAARESETARSRRMSSAAPTVAVDEGTASPGRAPPGAMGGPISVIRGDDRRHGGKKRGAPGGGVGFGSRAGAAAVAADQPAAMMAEPARQNRESYRRIVDNPWHDVTDEPLSTFSIDVDTASYANMRRFLEGGRPPPADAVRIEEHINYFDYSYEPPTGNDPFSVAVDVHTCPWNAEHRLVRIGLRGRDVDRDMRPATNLVFLLDVSGSMNHAKKLPLVKQSLEMLVEHLTADDRIALVVYAGASGLVLPSTYCDEKETILAAIGNLRSGGSTNGGAGIELAYRLAAESFIPGGVNRVILCTDGDFNVGVTSEGALTRLVEEKRDTGVFLTVLGFGTGNWQDDRMEQLSNVGNGNFAYIDGLAESRKVLVEQMAGTLVTIAKDVKIQVEFNPTRVAAYRLIGYANRLLADADFNDDRKDAGDIGAGHTVTALYEVVPAGLEHAAREVDPLRFQKMVEAEAADSDELMTVAVRYKEPDGTTSRRIDRVVRDTDVPLTDASDDFRFAAAVASFGMILRESPYRGSADFDGVLELAGAGSAVDGETLAEAERLIDEFTFEALAGRTDLARVQAAALVALEITDGRLVSVIDRDKDTRERFETALARCPIRDEQGDPIELVHARVSRGRAALASEAEATPSRRRAEFVRLVKKAKAITESATGN